MLPPVTLNNQPNPQAMALAARALSFLGRASESQPFFVGAPFGPRREAEAGALPIREAEERNSAALAVEFDARQITWIQNRIARDLDWSMYRDVGTLWINLYGTQNIPQILSYLTNTLPGYDTNIGSFVQLWARQRVPAIFEVVVRELERSLPSRIVICGHSLGGAAANILSRYIGNALFGADLPVWFNRPGMASVREAFLGPRPELVGSGTRIEVLTFGEPRSVGPSARFNPSAYWRVVATSPARPVDDVDIVTLLPPNIWTPPGPGILAGIEGLATSGARADIGFSPIHYGTPVYLTRPGRIVPEPLNALVRWATELAGNLVAWGDLETGRLHLLEYSYLPWSLHLANRVQPVEEELGMFANSPLGRYLAMRISAARPWTGLLATESGRDLMLRYLNRSQSLIEFRSWVRNSETGGTAVAPGSAIGVIEEFIADYVRARQTVLTDWDLGIVPGPGREGMGGVWGGNEGGSNVRDFGEERAIAEQQRALTAQGTFGGTSPYGPAGPAFQLGLGQPPLVMPDVDDDFENLALASARAQQMILLQQQRFGLTPPAMQNPPRPSFVR